MKKFLTILVLACVCLNAKYVTQEFVVDEYKPFLKQWGVDFTDKNARSKAISLQQKFAVSSYQPTQTLA